MPTRRTFTMVAVTIVLMQPVIALFRLEARKHLATSTNPVTRDAAQVVLNLS